MSNGIDVGDAVMTFLGDTTQLEAAQAAAGVKVEELGAKIEQVPAIAPHVPESIKPIGRESNLARSEVQLLGEATGVRLPRHVAAFVSSLGGVSEALNAAFAATAIFFLIEAVVTGAEKLGDFISKTWIYSDATKAADEASAKLNKEIADGEIVVRKAELALAEFGKTASQKVALEIKELEKEFEALQGRVQSTATDIDKAQKDLAKAETYQAARDNMNIVEKGLDLIGAAAQHTLFNLHLITQDTVKGVDEATAAVQKSQLDQKKADQDAQVARDAILLKQKEEAEAQRQEELKSLDLHQQLEKARQNITDAAAALALTKAGATDGVLLAQEAKHQENIYQIDLAYAKRRDAILSNGEDREAAKKAANDVVVLEKNRDAAILQNREKLEKQLRDIDTKIGETSLANFAKLSKQFDLAKDFDTGADAATRLANSLYAVGTAAEIVGIKTEEQMKKSIQDTTLAVQSLEKAEKNGEATEKDVLRAKIALVQQEIRFAQETGRSTAALDKQALELQHKLIPEANSFKTVMKGAADASGQAILSAAQAFGAGSATIGQALASIAAAELQAVAQVAWGEGTKQMALGFAALSPLSGDTPGPHFASAALWFSLGTGLSIASGAVGGSGGTQQGTSANPVVTTPATTANTPQATPVTTTNVQSFAGGGLVTRQTLALIGDSRGGGDAEEGIIPLTDPEAMARIGAAIAAHIGGGGVTVNVKGMISSDNLGKVVQKINKRVTKRQSYLQSSNSLRVTKRG